MNDVTAAENPDENRPLPWIYPILLAIAYNGDVLVQQIVYAPTGVVLPISMIKLAALLGLVGLLLLRRRPRRSPTPLMLACMAALILYAVLGLATSLIRSGGSGAFYPPLKAGIVLFVATVGVWAVCRVCETLEDLRRFGLVLTVFAAWVVLITVPEVVQGNLEKLMHGRAQQYGLLGLPIPSRMGIGVRVAPFVLMPFLFRPDRDRAAARRLATGVLIALAVVAFVLTVLFSGHRSALGGVMVALAYRQVRRASVRSLIQIVAGAALVFFVVANLSSDFSTALERAGGLFDLQTAVTDKSLKERRSAFRVAWDLFEEHPVVGVGFGGFKRAMGNEAHMGVYPHNIVLEYLVDVGVLGLPVLIFLALALTWGFAGQRADEAIAFAGSAIVYFLISLVSGDFLGHANLYMLIGLLPLLERLKVARAGA